MSLVPGKPEVLVIPFDNTPGQVQRQKFREQNDLDKPLVVRWARWAGRFVTGDMGNLYSSTGTNPVSKTVKSAAPISALLILYTQIVAILLSIPLAILSAYKNGKLIDKLIGGMAFSFLSLPGFAVALLLSYVFAVKMGWLPATGYTSPTDDLVEHFKSVVIPVISLSLGQIAVYMRLLRSDLIATLQEDFILMAKSKGISNRRVMWRHALRPSSLTLLTVVGLNVGNLIGGTIVVEALFSIPGMGMQIAYAILARQYVALQSYVAIIAIVFVLLNFLVDYLYTLLDPRIRERAA
ncbi:MAG: ABC transporter permease [Acidimicrobiales bacterium]|nr:ABC transporter permease [Acidimicrobiales bacterium]